MEDNHNIEILLNIIKSLFDNINKLKNVILMYGYNSEEYNNLVNVINNERELENSLMSKIAQSEEDAEKCLEYVVGYERKDFVDYLDDVENDNVEELIKKRFINKVNDFIILNELKNLDSLGLNFYSLNLAEKNVFIDVFNTIIKILSTYLDNPNYKKAKSRIMSYIYDIAFIDDSLLNSILSNDNTLYWSHMLYSNEITKGKINYTKEMCAIDILKEYTPKLTGEKKLYLVALYQSYVRASLLFLTKEEYEKLKEALNSAIDELKTKYDNIDMTDDSYLECLKYYEKDMEIPYILSFKR